MSMAPTARTDLTRWNRVGLSRFAYVDGNAATFLEDLRVAMLVRYLRGASGDARLFDYWRDLFTTTGGARPDAATLADLRAKLVWRGLLPDFPTAPERTPATNQRLINAYNAKTGDYTAEIMRALARAAHVLMGHANAYANEGYLRTATQWESLRRLATMVGYQPTPAASATTMVALLAHDGIGATDMDLGLVMRAPSPAGGPQLVFETIRKPTVHPALNAMRADGADRNLRSLPLTTGSGARFLAQKDVTVSPGDVVVLCGPTEPARKP